MPDLDLIKQAEQEVRDRRGRFARGRSGQYRRPHGCRDHVNRAARLLLAGDGEALTRKPVEMALAGDPTALRLCLERVVGPYRERGRAHDAADRGRPRGEELRAASRARETSRGEGQRGRGLFILQPPREVLL